MELDGAEEGAVWRGIVDDDDFPGEVAGKCRSEENFKRGLIEKETLARGLLTAS